MEINLRKNKKWFAYCLPTVSMEATGFVCLVLHQSHDHVHAGFQDPAVIWSNTYESYDFFVNLLFNPKYLWTRNIKYKDEGRWLASLLKTSLVHGNSSHILLSKIKVCGFSLIVRLVWDGYGLILDDLIQAQQWKLALSLYSSLCDSCVVTAFIKP